MIKNPVIRGFNPDPSIIRIDDTYYIATSTFQWWPGVEIYESKDLEHWRHHSNPLRSKSQLNMEGVADGGGVWAPCLSYDGDKVYLVYTVVKERGCTMQTDNYLVTTDDINGEWSEAVYLNSMGFDPSLFHDCDGKKYLLNLDNHYLCRFNGLWLTEFDDKTKTLAGMPKRIYAQKDNELVEGAHIYHIGEWYYLLKAQGGTGVRHSAQMSKSRSIWGPYEDDERILLHSRDNKDLYIQTAGHADIVETPKGWVMCHLGTRRGDGICGRETCMENVVWEDGWLRLEGGGENPKEEFDSGITKYIYGEKKKKWDFRQEKTDGSFKSLRESIKMDYSPKGLVMPGGAGICSKFEQQLLAIRIDDNRFYSETKVVFDPKCEKHLAGLIIYYNSLHWIFLHKTKSPEGRGEARLAVCDNGMLSIKKRAEYEREEAVFSARLEDGVFLFEVNGEFFEKAEARIVSDGHVNLGFTGAMAGMCAVDMYKKEETAVFEYFIGGN